MRGNFSTGEKSQLGYPPTTRAATWGKTSTVGRDARHDYQNGKELTQKDARTLVINVSNPRAGVQTNAQRLHPLQHPNGEKSLWLYWGSREKLFDWGWKIEKVDKRSWGRTQKGACYHQ